MALGEILCFKPPGSPPFALNYSSSFLSSHPSKVQVLYGGTDLFDYEVRRTFNNDMLLAFISSSCIAVLVYILTSCSGRLESWLPCSNTNPNVPCLSVSVQAWGRDSDALAPVWLCGTAACRRASQSDSPEQRFVGRRRERLTGDHE